MSTVKHEIAVEPRSTKGKGNARRDRKAGRIPAIVYSKGREPEMISLGASDWEVLSHHELNLVYLKGLKGTTACMVKEVQMNYLKNYVVHIDFQAVNLNEAIQAAIRIHTVGEAVGVNRGGVLEVVAHQVQVEGKPAELPEFIEVDIAGLNIGDAVHVRDLTLPKGIKAVDEADMVVVHVVAGQSDEAAEEGENAAAEPELVKAKAEEAQD